MDNGSQPAWLATGLVHTNGLWGVRTLAQASAPSLLQWRWLVAWRFELIPSKGAVPFARSFLDEQVEAFGKLPDWPSDRQRRR